MRRLIPFIPCDRGIAATELALVLPIIMMLLMGVTDFSLILYYKLRLEEAVNAGAQYAMTQGTSVTSANVVAVVQSASTMKADVSVTAGNNGNSTSYVGTTCHCYPQDWDATNKNLTGGRSVSTSTTGCNTLSACSSTTSELGRYLVIKASYNYSPILPFTFVTFPQVSETIVVRIN